MEIILASRSARRQEILSGLGIPFKVAVSHADETLSTPVAPFKYAETVSLRKAQAILSHLGSHPAPVPDRLIIAADTLVVCDGRILGKPKDKDDAREMLRLLSGKKHSVISGITAILGDRAVTEHEETFVSFRRLSDSEIESYISTDEPYDKAGGYGIQGKAAIFAAGIEGDYLNVVGLPVFRLFDLLQREFKISYFDLAEPCGARPLI